MNQIFKFLTVYHLNRYVIYINKKQSLQQPIKIIKSKLIIFKSMNTLQFRFQKSKLLNAIDKQKKNKILNQFEFLIVLKYYQFLWQIYKNLVIAQIVKKDIKKSQLLVLVEVKLNISNKIKHQAILLLKTIHP